MSKAAEVPPGFNKIRHPKKRAFLVSYALTGNVSVAAGVAGIDRTLYYIWLEKDKQFAAAAAEAREVAGDLLEEEARRRAYEGVDEPVIYQGELKGIYRDDDGKIVTAYTSGAKLIPLTIKKYDTTLLIFLLKGVRPDKFRERGPSFTAELRDKERSVTLVFGPGEDVP